MDLSLVNSSQGRWIALQNNWLINSTRIFFVCLKNFLCNWALESQPHIEAPFNGPILYSSPIWHKNAKRGWCKKALSTQNFKRGCHEKTVEKKPFSLNVYFLSCGICFLTQCLFSQLNILVVVLIFKIHVFDEACFSFFYSIWVFFHQHSRFIGQQGKGEGVSLNPLYHFHPLHRHLDNSRAITTGSSLLHLCQLSQQPDSNREPLVSESKLLTTKLRTLHLTIRIHAAKMWEKYFCVWQK